MKSVGYWLRGKGMSVNLQIYVSLTAQVLHHSVCQFVTCESRRFDCFVNFGEGVGYH